MEFVTLLTLTAVMLAGRGDAEGVPPPTGVSYVWLDLLTLRVSWKKPIGNFQYMYMEKSTGEQDKQSTPWRNFTVELLTENMVSDNWTYLIQTVGGPSVSQIIKSPKPRAEVNDIKCVIHKTSGTGINCSWIPGNQMFNLSYRVFGMNSNNNKKFTPCTRPYSSPTRNGCYLDHAKAEDSTCMLFETQTGYSTYEMKPMVDPPELSIKEEGGELKLSFSKPKVPQNCIWTYNVCYSKCNHPKECQNFIWNKEPMFVPYKKDCRYDFWSSIKAGKSCKGVFSDFGKVVSYNSTATNDTLTVVSIVLPIVLSVCIFLSCYCFRRYSSIICPVIPDPSAIFKEMMMNGNKELKTTGTLYAPVPEPIESCRVDPVPDYMLKS
ncbi:interleukin-13 receptor subunit alpha-1-like isoform X1 [Pungitius pungitius]|uniref:interleukin-13 receptor subunit alpha-1-like isoform X1 n=1 Tax=Pungitius pungitius TaxID=134920 RepID=UPI002E0F911D